MKAVLIGYGEVGKGLYEALSKYHNIAIHDPALEHLAYDDFLSPDVLLISIPYNEKFIDIIKKYQDHFKSKAIVIFSTVPVGTCRKLNALHSPIEGRHDNMSESIRMWPRWIGGVKDGEGLVGRFFTEAGLFVNAVPYPEITEFLKLRSLAVYGIQIEIARYSKQIADNLWIPYELIKQYDRDYNNLVDITAGDRFQRPILDPPVGDIGGHCVLKGMKLLQEDSNCSHPFIQTVLDLNHYIHCCVCGKGLESENGITSNAWSKYDTIKKRIIGIVCNDCFNKEK